MNKQAHLVTIECSFGDRSDVIEEQVDYNHTVIKVETKHEIWLKESMINLAISRLPKDWKYVAWIDADITFVRPDWVGECLHILQHHPIIQMFSVAVDVDSNHIPYQIHSSFCHDYINGVKPSDYYRGLNRNTWHPGYAWAATRKAISDLGGLIDWAILGAGDNHMAYSLIGNCDKSMHKDVNGEYRNMVRVWQERAEKYIKRNVGYMDGTIIHYYHGAKVNRRYYDRWQILTKNNFQPSLDLKRDWNGLYQLTDRIPKLRRDIQQYFRQRDEDNTDMKGTKSLI